VPVGLQTTVRAARLSRRAAIRNVERLLGRVAPVLPLQLVLLTLMLIGTLRDVLLLLLR
jgi:hypothetical protein